MLLSRASGPSATIGHLRLSPHSLASQYRQLFKSPGELLKSTSTCAPLSHSESCGAGAWCGQACSEAQQCRDCRKRGVGLPRFARGRSQYNQAKFGCGNFPGSSNPGVKVKLDGGTVEGPAPTPPSPGSCPQLSDGSGGCRVKQGTVGKELGTEGRSLR